MVARGTPLPARIRPDAIVEALLEVRFEVAGIPEILFGRLSDEPQWTGFHTRRMPAYQLPAQMRSLDAALRYQPILELVDSTEAPTCALRLGPQSLSYHRLREYGGWARFRPELEQVVASMFDKAEGLTVQRLGLRYLNGLRSDVHGIRSIADLDLRITMAGTRLAESMNLNFTRELGPDSTVGVRIATANLVQGAALPAHTTVYVDVDVYTPEAFQTTEQDVVRAWIGAAHDAERIEFFHLLTGETIRALEENAR